MLAASLGDRLAAYYVREERPGAKEALLRRADENEQALKAIVPNCHILQVDVFADDGAPVGGSRIVSLLEKHGVPADVTDVILDLSALSIGVGFPAARLLLEDCEARDDRAFHLMIVSNPEMDDLIASVPGNRPGSVRGFSPPIGDAGQDIAQVWIPQLARGRMSSLTQIGADIGRATRSARCCPFRSGTQDAPTTCLPNTALPTSGARGAGSRGGEHSPRHPQYRWRGSAARINARRHAPYGSGF